jgi:stage II sporulation protein Q
MSEQNKDIQSNEEAPKSIEGAPAVRSSSWKRLLAKKWVFPATYMAAAAIILTLMWVYQDSGDRSLTDSDLGVTVTKPGSSVTDAVSGPDAMPVNATTEKMQWPVSERGEVDVIMHFFESDASNELRQAAVVEYGSTFIPHMGVDLAKHDDQPFDVVAAMSGNVLIVEKHAIVGNQVVISHDNGLVTVYQSLDEVAVKKGDQVKQGDLIGKAGRNELEKKLGVHVHFEVRQGLEGTPQNPAQYLPEVKTTTVEAQKN